jgi:hypothetical protein
MRDQRTQSWMADPAELFRVFPPVPALSDALLGLPRVMPRRKGRRGSRANGTP